MTQETLGLENNIAGKEGPTKCMVLENNVDWNYGEGEGGNENLWSPEVNVIC